MTVPFPSLGTEAPSGRLGAVLRAVDADEPVAMGRTGPWLVTSPADSRRVLTDTACFDFPLDVSRRAVRRGGGRAAASGPPTPHETFAALGPAAVAVGRQVVVDELRSRRDDPGTVVEAMDLLRAPVARSTAAAALPDLDPAARDEVADLVLSWVDALGPVIAHRRNPARFSRVRRRESAARRRLEQRLTEAGEPDPATVATFLAAGTQVPIAAGAWLLVALAAHPDVAADLRAGETEPSAVVWETLRLTPPTWVTGRVTAGPVQLGSTRLPAHAVTLVSPLLLGRRAELVPGPEHGGADRAAFSPRRWTGVATRPGAWLPFGAGPHACPGRNLGLAQLLEVVAWAGRHDLEPGAVARVDQSRGIFPAPSTLVVHPRHPDRSSSD